MSPRRSCACWAVCAGVRRRRLLLGVHARPRSFALRFGVSLPLKELAKWKVLHDRELAQDFRVVHLDHALVDLAPAVFDARDVEQDGRVFPERTLFDVVDELDCTEVHVAGFVLRDCIFRRDAVGSGR